MVKRVSLINFKGGVGKTTLAFQFGCWLASQRDTRVLLCDVDHQSSLSITCLGGTDWDAAVRGKTTIDKIFRHMTEEASPLPGREIIHHPGGDLGRLYPRLDVVPSALSLDETEIDLTGSMRGNAVESEWHKRTLICDWLEKNRIDDDYDYVLFDCPPATKIVTQNALATSHGYIVPAIPDAVSIRGTPHLTNQILSKIESQFATLSEFLTTKGKHIASTFVPRRRLVGIVIFRIKPAGSYSGWTNDATEHYTNLQRIYNHGEIIQPLIEEGVGVSQSLTWRLPVYQFPRHVNIGGRGFPRIFSEVSRELQRRIDTL
jgi:chromosome partitioning protein